MYTRIANKYRFIVKKLCTNSSVELLVKLLDKVVGCAQWLVKALVLLRAKMPSPSGGMLAVLPGGVFMPSPPGKTLASLPPGETFAVEKMF